MKTTFFRKIFIFIVLILSFGFNSSFAENRTLDDIKKEIQVLKKEFENTKTDLEKQEISKDIEKLLNEFLEKNPKVIKINQYIQSRSLGTIPWYENLETGDIIVTKGPDRNKIWAIGGWSHALIIYDKNLVFEIENTNDTSKIKNISRIRYMIESGKYKEFAILKMGLNNSEKENMKKYISKNLLGKKYNFFSFLDTYYCTSLIWKAHLESGKKNRFG